jgi:hypothetical protein
MNSPSDFSLNLTALTNLTNAQLSAYVRATVIDIGKKIIYMSPVGDPTHWKDWNAGGYAANTTHWLVKAGFVGDGYTGGRFRGNWQHTTGAAASGDLPDIDASGSHTEEKLRASVNTGSPFVTHYIVNNLPYAQALEDGHSQNQAPLGIINQAMLNFTGIVSAGGTR